MALSNYVLQSVVGTLLFDGYGLGWFGHVGPAARIALAVGIFALHVPLSHVWLSYFRFGPADYAAARRRLINGYRQGRQHFKVGRSHRLRHTPTHWRRITGTRAGWSLAGPLRPRWRRVAVYTEPAPERLVTRGPTCER
jgi:hypothetical protein